MDYAKTLVRGRVASEPIFKDNHGIKLSSFDLACHNGRLTEFYNIVAFGAVAEFTITNVKKEDQILIEGALYQQRIRAGNGEIENKTIINAHCIHILR